LAKIALQGAHVLLVGGQAARELGEVLFSWGYEVGLAELLAAPKIIAHGCAAEVVIVDLTELTALAEDTAREIQRMGSGRTLLALGRASYHGIVRTRDVFAQRLVKPHSAETLHEILTTLRGAVGKLPKEGVVCPVCSLNVFR
jgi:hypothetical protein